MDKDLLRRATAAGAGLPNQPEQMKRMIKIGRDIVTYHTSPVEAAELAREAGVKKLVFTHIAGIADNFVTRMFFLRGVSDVYDGDVMVANDGDWLDL